MHDPPQRRQVSQEVSLRVWLRAALRGHHRLLLLHLLACAAEQAEAGGTKVCMWVRIVMSLAVTNWWWGWVKLVVGCGGVLCFRVITAGALFSKESHQITPPIQGEAEGSVRLRLTINPACSFSYPLPGTRYIV